MLYTPKNKKNLRNSIAVKLVSNNKKLFTIDIKDKHVAKDISQYFGSNS